MRRALMRWRDTLSKYHQLKKLTDSVSKKLRLRKLRIAFETYQQVYKNLIREKYNYKKAEIMFRKNQFIQV